VRFLDWLKNHQRGAASVAAILLLTACTGSKDVLDSPSVPASSVSAETSPPPVVPDLVGLSLSDARSEAELAGITTVVVKREFSSEPMGTVVEQDVSAGTPLAAGDDQIQVVVSVFPRVPSLVGLSLAKARARLSSLSLRLGPVRKVASTEDKGVVLRQGVKPQRRVPAGTRVRVVIVSPHVCGSPLNPWCFSVAGGGSVIFNPPFDLCSWIDCIPSFWDSTNGYVIQCSDGEFSHSGGVSGSCSSHGGNWRPLYRP
jgi:hypothetical protein